MFKIFFFGFCIVVIYFSCFMLSKESKEEVDLRKFWLKILLGEVNLICI